MTLRIQSFAVNEQRSFENLGVKENNFFRLHFMPEFDSDVEQIREIDKVFNFSLR